MEHKWGAWNGISKRIKGCRNEIEKLGIIVKTIDQLSKRSKRKDSKK